jgi:hypothetical protein
VLTGLGAVLLGGRHLRLLGLPVRQTPEHQSPPFTHESSTCSRLQSIGEDVGTKDEAALGAKGLLGDADANLVGEALGILDGDSDGDLLGAEVEGDADGSVEGVVLGILDGDADGDLLGTEVVGDADGSLLGEALGILDGDADANLVR